MIIHRIKEIHLNRLVPLYLMSSFLYYRGYNVGFRTFLSDGDYDKLCQRIAGAWCWIRHPHKHLIDYESLVSGTAYTLKYEDYPMVVKCAAITALDKHTNKEEIWIYD